MNKLYVRKLNVRKSHHKYHTYLFVKFKSKKLQVVNYFYVLHMTDREKIEF